VKAASRDFKYSADIVFKVDVIWHKKPKGGPEPVKAPVRGKETVFNEPNGHMTKWDQTVNEKGVVVAVVLVVVTAAASILYRIATRGGLQPAQIMPPFTHTIDRHHPQA
jgi:hypothetical protein